MKIIESEIPDVLKIIPELYKDSRGAFCEIYNDKYRELLNRQFLQSNVSFSKENVLRGLHYQVKRPQGKLITCLSGFVQDVAVDIRPDSIYFGKWVSFELNGYEKEQVWIPEGFAHGFYVPHGEAVILYQTTDYYFPAGERTIVWNDPDINVGWKWMGLKNPIVSEKDSEGILLKNINKEEIDS